MANTINDLYLKYANSVRKMENDRYFQYLYELIQASENVFEQKNQILHKVVDERWLTTIEDSLDSISKIIENPRRFIQTKEEVVPVSLAKKITADSVRHLSQNTQFIASTEDGDVQPTRILNVSVEESYDLYENRFIYHLIQRLVTFIDKRTDVIFWSTGDETSNDFKMESKIDDAYEEITYKIQMNIKNRQSYIENDSDNMTVFMRIDRVRRLVLTLRQSSFCSIMKGCSKVRSPIQRTNLLMKDPDYRKCYKLWQFLENYDEVGYTIETIDQMMDVDEEYVIQMYTNLIANYSIFKSLLESDPRRITPNEHIKRKKVKPKFVKKIEEQIVPNADIEDVEIRRVFLEEVTQAQLDAEARAEEAEKARAEAEEALATTTSERDEAVDRVEIAEMQMNMAVQMQHDAEGRLAVAEEARKSAEADRDSAVAKAEEEKNAAIAQAEEEKNVAIARAEEEKNAAIAQAEEEKQTFIAQREQEITEYKAAVDAQRDETIAAIQNQSANEIADTKAQADSEIAETKAQAANEIAETKAQAADEIAETKAQAADEIAQMKAQAASEIAEAKAEADLKIAEMKAKAEAEIAEMKARAEAEIAEMRAQMEASEQTAAAARESEAEALDKQQKALEEAEMAKTQAEEALLKADSAEKARMKAEAISRSGVIPYLFGRRTMETEEKPKDNSENK